MSTKDDILNAATELFSQKGFEGVSIREIASLAKVHFTSIRYNFGDKDQLYKACISKHGEDRLRSAERFLSAEPTCPKDMRLRFKYAIEDFFRIHYENPFLTKLILLEIESNNKRSDAILKKTMVAMNQVFVTFFTLSLEKGFIKKILPPLFLTQSLMGIMHHYVRTEQTRKRLLANKSLKAVEEKEALIENILTLFLEKE